MGKRAPERKDTSRDGQNGWTSRGFCASRKASDRFALRWRKDLKWRYSCNLLHGFANVDTVTTFDKKFILGSAPAEPSCGNGSRLQPLRAHLLVSLRELCLCRWLARGKDVIRFHLLGKVKRVSKWGALVAWIAGALVCESMAGLAGGGRPAEQTPGVGLLEQGTTLERGV